MANEKKWRIYYCKTDWIFDDLIARVGIPKLVIRRCGIVLFIQALDPRPIRQKRVFVYKIGREM